MLLSIAAQEGRPPSASTAENRSHIGLPSTIVLFQISCRSDSSTSKIYFSACASRLGGALTYSIARCFHCLLTSTHSDCCGQKGKSPPREKPSTAVLTARTTCSNLFTLEHV